MVEQVECGRLSPGWILPIGSVLSELQQLAVQLVYDDLDRGTGGGLQHRTNEANHLLGFTVPGAVQHLDNHCYGCQRNWRLQHDRKLLLRRYGSQLDRHVYSRANAFADLKGGSKSTTSSRGSAAGSALELPLMRRHGGCGGGGCGGGSSSSGHAGRPAGSQERKITQSLVTLSCVFVALNVPSYSLRLRDYVLVATGRIPQNQPLSEIILENVFNLIYYTNFSINFFVYCLSSENFRSAAWQLWHEWLPAFRLRKRAAPIPL
ncbi:conserved hypothetical protein [Trichinella spiralis]|uniref:hypothetical protein n=1 Tax=Trichinella spiralis TaxID=6334 RepID=UPI0001EFDCBC|nr:conserved hypothetical protein [Trichinella spiralis]